MKAFFRKVFELFFVKKEVEHSEKYNKTINFLNKYFFPNLLLLKKLLPSKMHLFEVVGTIFYFFYTPYSPYSL